MVKQSITMYSIFCLHDENTSFEERL